MSYWVEEFDGEHYVHHKEYMRVCDELKEVKALYEDLKECCGCSDLKTAGTEMSDKVCGTCKYWSQMVCPDCKCTVLEDTCNALQEEMDELKRSNHDKDVMIATLMTVAGVRV